RRSFALGGAMPLCFSPVSHPRSLPSPNLFFFFPSYGHHRHLHSFPTRRSSDLSAAGEFESSGCELLTQLVRVRGQVAVGTELDRSEEHTSELQSRFDLVCRLLLEKKKCDQAGANTPHHLHEKPLRETSPAGTHI